jgi:hypothetical protein
MMAKRLIVLAILAVFAGGVSAQGISGTWNATVQTAQGPLMLAFELVAEGKELVGSMISDFMAQTPISDGKVDGEKLSFRMALDAIPGATMVINFSGHVDGDELTLTSKFEGEAPPGTEAEQTFVARRAEEPGQ